MAIRAPHLGLIVVLGLSAGSLVPPADAVIDNTQ